MLSQSEWTERSSDVQAVSPTSSRTHAALSLTRNRAEVEERERLEHDSEGGQIQTHRDTARMHSHTQ